MPAEQQEIYGILASPMSAEQFNSLATEQQSSSGQDNLDITSVEDISEQPSGELASILPEITMLPPIPPSQESESMTVQPVYEEPAVRDEPAIRDWVLATPAYPNASTSDRVISQDSDLAGVTGSAATFEETLTTAASSQPYRDVEVILTSQDDIAEGENAS